MDRDSVAIVSPRNRSYSSDSMETELGRMRSDSSGDDSNGQAADTPSKPLLKLKLLDSLRQGNFKQLEALVRTEFQPAGDPNVEEVKNLALHYAVQVAPTSLIKEIVEEWGRGSSKGRDGITIDINYQDENGDTPLHLSAFQSRGDVVDFLMDQTQINDCILNNSHLQPVEMCRDLNIAHLMQSKRGSYVAEIAQEFRTAFNNRDFNHLDSILSNPRNAELLDINGMDPETGDTVLHEFVKKRDVIMCRWLLEHGADPFHRDSQGRLPMDLIGRVNENDSAPNTKVAIDIELKKLLSKAAKEQSVIDVTNNLHEPPTYKGYLRKWTNFAQGYKLRWFILSGDGKLSYYKDQADTRNACRGSLNMSTCYLHLDSSEKLKFEIIGGSNGAIRWHLKANHPVETNRWVWAIQGAIRFAKDKDLMMKSGTVPPSLAMSRGLSAGNRNDSPLYASQLHDVKRTGTLLDGDMRFGNGSSQGRATSDRLKRASTASSELRLNTHLTRSGKEYVNRMVGSRLDSTSRSERSRTNSTVSHHHPNEKSAVTNESSNDANAGSHVDNDLNGQKQPPSEVQSDSKLQQQHDSVHTDAAPQQKKSVPARTATTNPSVAAKVPRSSRAFESAPLVPTSSHVSSTEEDINSSDEDEDDHDGGSNFDADDEDFRTQYGPYSQRLLMIQRSLSMDLSSLNELLDTGRPSEEAWNMLKKSLGSISNLFEKMYFLTSARDKKLGFMLQKQREVNNVWIQSVKDLELELIEKSNRLASLDKERRSLKRLLQKRLSASAAGSQFNSTRRKTGDSSATLQGIARFIEATREEDEESDADVFFDAEDLVNASEEEIEPESPEVLGHEQMPPSVAPPSIPAPIPHRESMHTHRKTPSYGNYEPRIAAPPSIQNVQNGTPLEVRPERDSVPEPTHISPPSTHPYNPFRKSGSHYPVNHAPHVSQNHVEAPPRVEYPARSEDEVNQVPSEPPHVEPLVPEVPKEQPPAVPAAPATPAAPTVSTVPVVPAHPAGVENVAHDITSGGAPSGAAPGAAGGAAPSEAVAGAPVEPSTGAVETPEVESGAVQNVEPKKKPAEPKPEQQGATKSNALSVVGTTQPQKKKSSIILKEGSFKGYEDGVRKRLKLDEDDRPAISLWSVLKSMVGKDMTKMTLPVTFNEPTSLLQRVTEDLEYSELLDTAATFSDSTLRLLYVAIFTASSYASTIKRVAKPFNPLLGETFEYCRPDKGYRFFTEQVSHHPVISATWTDSPKWDFWGESNVDTKFNGRAFNIKHLGLWYVRLRPDNGDPEELYTWHKPNNTVIGILVGNPQVDNNGDVEIVNHNTGDRCLINFKARGWRSQGAYEVTGEVLDKKRNKKWMLGGHWNEAIYAKMVTPKNKGDLMKTKDTNSMGPKFDGSKFLVWKASPRPDAPFNLTPFAITLNAPQPHLIPWLAPTDTRLRPDQRDMEDGRYDEAGDEKQRLEEKQRAVRRKRAETGQTYKPLWFQKKIHPVTKAEYWQFNGEYWKLRNDRKLKDVSPNIF